jgi:ABC-type phosphate transport system auxiliary subunit
VLAGGADRDVSDMKTLLRAHTQTLNALRETQIEQGQKLTDLDAKLDARTTSLQAQTTSLQAQIDGLRAEMRRGFGTLHTGMAQLLAAFPNQQGEGDQPE